MASNSTKAPVNAISASMTTSQATVILTPCEATPLMQNTSITKTRTTWQEEAARVGQYSGLLVIANLLQFILNMSSIFIVSPLGKIELGAVSVACTTANITGFIVFQGLSTSLDILCAQAWGSGKVPLISLHIHKMVLLLHLFGLVVATFWLFAGRLFALALPDEQVAGLAGSYLRILICAIPSYIIFETQKRNLTSRGTFLPVTLMMSAGALINLSLGWLLVWHMDLGFIGAPIAVAITWTLLASSLLLYLGTTEEAGIWPREAASLFKDWHPMMKLAVPGLIMVEAEYLAFEALIFASAQLSTASLAAQTILATINNAFWQIPFSISIAGTTRIAQNIGAGSLSSARLSAIIVFSCAVTCSSVNSIVFFSFKTFWPSMFTDDPDVIRIAEHALPVVAVMHLFDGLAACCNGMLRGIGRPVFGGWTNLICYYAIGLPLSLWTTFHLSFGVGGLWFGVAIALVVVTISELLFLVTTNWQKCVDDAQTRNNV